MPIRLAKSYFTSYVVSGARMKTHDTVVVTLTIKNTAIGSIINPDRSDPGGDQSSRHEPEVGTLSHDPRALNLSLVRLVQAARPGLAVIDGVVGMEGNGPVSGTPVSSGIALAGTDCLAVDLLGAELMRFDTRAIGYLWYLGQLEGLRRRDIHALGEDPSKLVTRYRAHDEMPWQLGWWVENWRDHVGGNYLRS